jgi:hypothetical protein
LIDSGQTNDVVDHYERLLAGSSESMELMRLRAIDADGRSTDVINPGEDIQIEALLRVPDDGIPDDVTLAIDLYDEEGAHLFGRSSSVPVDLPLNHVDGGRLAIARGRIHKLPLRYGALKLVATLQQGADNEQVLGRRESVVDVQPAGISAERGMLHLDHEWQWTADGRVQLDMSAEAERKDA